MIVLLFVMVLSIFTGFEMELQEEGGISQDHRMKKMVMGIAQAEFKLTIIPGKVSPGIFNILFKWENESTNILISWQLPGAVINGDSRLQFLPTKVKDDHRIVFIAF